MAAGTVEDWYRREHLGRWRRTDSVGDQRTAEETGHAHFSGQTLDPSLKDRHVGSTAAMTASPLVGSMRTRPAT
jgi:hypothetical protein